MRREHPLDEVGRKGQRGYAEHDAQDSIFGEDGWRLVLANRVLLGAAVREFAAKGSGKRLRQRLAQWDQPRCERAASVAASPPFSTYASNPRSLKM
jgi:hypothetical protein